MKVFKYLGYVPNAMLSERHRALPVGELVAAGVLGLWTDKFLLRSACGMFIVRVLLDVGDLTEWSKSDPWAWESRRRWTES